MHLYDDEEAWSSVDILSNRIWMVLEINRRYNNYGYGTTNGD